MVPIRSMIVWQQDDVSTRAVSKNRHPNSFTVQSQMVGNQQSVQCLNPSPQEEKKEYKY